MDCSLPRGKASDASKYDATLPYVTGTSAPDGFYAKLLVEVVQFAAFGAFAVFGSDVRSEIYNHNLLAASTRAPLVRY